MELLLLLVAVALVAGLAGLFVAWRRRHSTPTLIAMDESDERHNGDDGTNS